MVMLHWPTVALPSMRIPQKVPLMAAELRRFPPFRTLLLGVLLLPQKHDFIELIVRYKSMVSREGNAAMYLNMKP